MNRSIQLTFRVGIDWVGLDDEWPFELKYEDIRDHLTDALDEAIESLDPEPVVWGIRREKAE